MRNVLIVGAGKLGKGFLGEVFDAAKDWKVSFLDKDPRVIENLKKPEGYKVMCCREDRTDHRVITDYEAFLVDDGYSVADAAIHADVIMMPLYPEDFDDAAPYLGKIFQRRAKENPAQKLDIICNTNKNHLMEHIEEMFYRGMENQETIAWFKDNAALRDSIIRRSTIADTNYSTDIRTGVVASLLIQPPLYNDLSDVEWMELKDNILLLKDLKLYTINSTHATCAYAGYLKGYTTVEDSIADPEISQLFDDVMEESSFGLTHEFPITKEDIFDMCRCLKIQTKDAIYDQLLRVCWDPARKLSRNDRLTGNAMYCYEHGLDPVHIMITMANAFAYDDPRDPVAMDIQKKIKEQGIEKTVSEICSLPIDHHITQCVAENYRRLMANRK